MLYELSLKNFIFVKDLTIQFTKGLQILSGETGAGKSVIVGAIHLLMGGQLKANVHFDKEKKVVLSAVFTLEDCPQTLKRLIEQYDIDISDEELFFSREITSDQKSNIFINGRKVTNTIVKEFRDCLFDFHSQRDQLLILSEDFQLLCLDHFAQADPLRESFAELYQQYHQQQARLQKLINEEKHSEDKQKLYEYQIKEINDLNLRIDEEHELESEREILSNAQDILDHSLEFHQALFESENALYDQISFYSLYYEKFDQENHLLKEMSELLKSVLTQMEDMNQISRRIPQEIFLDADRLSEVEQRLKDIYQLKTKYHRSIPEIIQFKEEMEKFVNEKSTLKDQIQNLSEDQDRLADQLIEKANRLTEIRERSALEFAKEIETNLQDLAIPSAQVKIKVDKLEETHNDKKKIVSGFRESGQDQVSVLFNANKGGDLQLLKHAASGGELSRLLLVIKKILASNLPPQSIVFDEIDSGIGGKTADMLGAYIYKISKYHQIICITHLPQVASYADRQFKIEKLDDLEKTEIQVKVLEDSDRLNEIARMLSGSLSQNALNHAQELIDKRKN